MTDSRATHGVLVTYQRPATLARHLARLSTQTRRLSTLTVVDNDADPEVKALVESSVGDAAAFGATRYLPAPGNPGPAGGFTLGIAEVLTGEVADDDLVVLLDDNDPPRVDTVFADTVEVLEHLRESHPDVGGVGSWGASLGRRGRLRMARSTSPEVVDYIAGGACPHYTVAAIRESGGPDPGLFFGFEELDLGRSLGRAGWRLWSSGLAREHGWAEMMEPSRAAVSVTAPTWRRYYSVRNLVTVLRRDGRTADALFVTVTAGLGKPVLNLVIRPRTAWANLRLTAPAVIDAWRNRLGRRIEPADVA